MAQVRRLRSLLAYMWAHPGKQLFFMGGEFGQRDEWSDRGLEWWVLDYPIHQSVQRLSRDLNVIYRQAPALWELYASPEGFSWIDANDAQGNVLSFLRFAAAADDRPRPSPGHRETSGAETRAFRPGRSAGYGAAGNRAGPPAV